MRGFSRCFWIVAVVVFLSSNTMGGEQSYYTHRGVVYDPPAGAEAFYICVSAAEHQGTPVKAVYILVGDREMQKDKNYIWWELTAVHEDGRRFGIKILSEHVPMTCPEAPGEILRYIYLTPNGECFDYRNERDDAAVLPQMNFVEDFLPQPSPYARYEEGFATVGAFLGHVLVKTLYKDIIEPLEFPEPEIIRLRPDLLIGTQNMSRSDYAPKKEDGSWPEPRPYTIEDIETMIEAGMNYFGPINTEQLDYIKNRAVFFRTMPTFPETFYRSNFVPGRMFLDEPMVRLGWSGRIPAYLLGPEQVAQSLIMDVISHYEPRQIQTTNYRGPGNLFLMEPKAPSWDTMYWSAWYQLKAGAPGIIHEGRYIHRGYGWEPEQLFGEGLEGLTDMDMFNCMFAFLRGAARAFNGYWGISVYPEGDPNLRLPAMIRAYDMGARCIWIWNDPNFPYLEQVRLLRGLKEHMRKHPRGNPEELLRKAEVGIAFPAGYVFNWNGTWGMERERLTRAGASYAEISAAGLWEGILLSRQGVEFDFLVDEPVIYKMGYKRLIIVHEDGTVSVDPPWDKPRAPKGLRIEIEKHDKETVAERMKVKPDIIVPQAKDFTIDGDLSDWKDADWHLLTLEQNGFGDTFQMDIVLTNVASEEEVKANERYYMGFEYDQINEEYERKYKLAVPEKGKGVVITKVIPGSPADKAGLREGDVVYRIGAYRTWWGFEMYRALQKYKTAYGARIPLHIMRSGKYRLGGSDDLEAKFALAVDDDFLYVAVQVRDDVHYQRHYGWNLWQGDSVQLAFDPTLERREAGYGEQDHEIGFALKDGKPIAWRWKGRRGQPVGVMDEVELAIVRKGDETLYEAKIPLCELAPLNPGMWRKCGFDIVVNDSDGELERKGRVELCPFAMTAGKHPRDFAVLEFANKVDPLRIPAAIMWVKRCTQTPGYFKLRLASSSLRQREASVVATLRSLDSPATKPISQTITLPVSKEACEWELRIWTESPPGRYRLKVDVVNDQQSRVEASDELSVYVY